MKVIFFGLGSIGQRHLENLKTLATERGIALSIDAFKSVKRPVDESIENVRYIFDMRDMEAKYDIAFITNPTALHYETLREIIPKTEFVFLEKPVFERSKSILEFEKIEKKVYVAAPLRYKQVMASLENIVAEEEIVNARVICSSYLPEWRKTDYRLSYSAKSTLGGGVELDCIHEIDYVIHLFGFPTDVVKKFGRKSSLAIESNDTALYIFEYQDKFVEIHLDYFGRNTQRKIELMTNKGMITVDFLLNNITYSYKKEKDSFEEAANNMYLNELCYFFDKVMLQKENNNDLRHANEVLKICKE